MKTAAQMFLALSLAFSVQQGRADAGDVAETLSIVWESYWHQSGYPVRVAKWRNPIRVKFTGVAVDRHREFALRQLQTVAEIAGIEAAEAGSDGAGANLEVEFVATLGGMPSTQPCVTNFNTRNGVIYRTRVRANELSVWRCMLHESMHVMGISGHPHANSMLTYFARGEKLTEADKLMLKTIYSSEVEPGMLPLPFIEIVARRVVDAVPAGADRSEAEAAAKAFLRNTIREMEAFAKDGGDPPVILLRSSKTTSAGLARGRVDMQFYLGVAYTRGQIVEVDKKKGVEWLTRAAHASHTEGQLMLGEAYFNGSGVDADPVEGYKWCYLAAEKGAARAKLALQAMESRLQPGQIAEGKARAAAWQQAKS